MKTDWLWFGIWSLALLPACKGDDALLLPFAELCSARAENICSVRVPPCCAEDARAPDCIELETAACEKQRKQIAGVEGDLDYHASRASEKVDAELIELEQCQPPRPLPSFFEGALEEGAACKRDTQCVTGACGAESGVCESAADVALCPGE
ncbi:MAG TPA: hypothetical protein VFZ61_27240 [Polyangiales bacterium]